MPSPDAVAVEMTRIVRTAGELADLAQHVGDAYAELHDGAFRKAGGTSGYEKPIAAGDFQASDPTGEIATSGMHKRMRERVFQAASYIRRVHRPLERAADIMVEAWAEQDPEAQEKLRRLRQLEKEIAGQTELTVNQVDRQGT